MAILVGKDSRVIVQGITGKEASFHTEQMLSYGTNVLGGVTPGKGGQTHLGLPVFDSVLEAKSTLNANVSIIFVPAMYAAEAIIEAAFAGISVIITITEGIPVKDMQRVLAVISGLPCTLVGPNCPGIITPPFAKVGIMPGFVFPQGRVGVISKSGTLTYEVADQIQKNGFGVSTAVGIGGDALIGLSPKEALHLFMNDEDTDAVVLIGEIGGTLEIEAAKYYKTLQQKKPVIGFIAGHTAPMGRTMGHAGAIVGGEQESAAFKTLQLSEAGVMMVNTLADIGVTLRETLA